MYSQLIQKVFPKIIGVGKNYIKHVKEMGGNQIPKQPIIFFKPWTSLNYQPHVLQLPKLNHEIHHQIQLAVFIKSKCKNITVEQSKEVVGGYAVSLDITDRDLQAQSKKNGYPWCLSKGQDNFCPIGNIVSSDQVKDPHNLKLCLTINGKIVQQDMTSSMHFNIYEQISYVSKYVTLNSGDILLTGTPSGVGPLLSKDVVVGELRSEQKVISKLQFRID